MGDDKAHEVTHGAAPPEAASLSSEKRREMLLQLATWESDAIWSGYWLKG
jgi:hypothetical protein